MWMIIPYPWTSGSTWSLMRCTSRSSFDKLFFTSPVAIAPPPLTFDLSCPSFMQWW